MALFRDIQEVMVYPENFFAHAGSEREFLQPPILVVLTVSGLSFVALVLLNSEIIGSFQRAVEANPYLGWIDRRQLEETLAFMKPQAVLLTAFSSLFAFFLWLVGTGILVSLSILAGGQGKFRLLLRLTGFAYSPLILVGLISVLVVLLVPLDVSFYQVTTADDMERLIERTLDLRQELNSSLPVVLLKNLNLVFYGWVYFLWVMAVHHAEKLSYSKSVAVVAVTASLLHGIPWLVTR